MPSEQQYLSQCPNCASQIDVTALEPFAKINCPGCRQTVRVRRKFDQFVIIKQIGEGGMSRVFEAEDESLGRRVALKILNRTYSKDAARMAQFQQEALITARVTHPNVIKLYSAGFDQGNFFIAMELVSGGSLEARIKRDGQVPEKDALRIGRQVAEGLRAAYRMGLLHRDVKPQNILFTEEGVAKVVDFGLALFADRKDETGEIWATPYYVSPEKIIENHEDFRSDLFSLGATLYHALTGKPPHDANTSSIEELRMIKCRRVALEESDIKFAPRTLHIIDKLTAFDPAQRPESYDDAVDQLRLAEGLSEHTIMSTMSWRRKIAFVAAGALVLAYGIGWLAQTLTAPKGGTYTSSTSLAQSDLTGDGKTVSAGQRVPAERYLDARKLFLEGKLAEAEKRFRGIIEEQPSQPTLNRARIHAAIIALISGEKGRAKKLFIDLRDDTDTSSSGLHGNDNSAFYVQLGKRMADEFGLKTYAATLDYAPQSEAALGWLTHGIAQWYLGSLPQARACFQKFQSITQTDPTLLWLNEYHQLIAPYLADAEVFTALKAPDSSMTEEQLQAVLDATQKARKQLKLPGPLPATLEQRIAQLKTAIATQHRTAQTSDLKAQAQHRREELQQFSEINKQLPLARLFDFSPSVEILTDLQFDLPEVRAAADSRLYLYKGAVEFTQLLFKDIAGKSWTGRVQRREGPPLDGRVTAISHTSITLSLARGALTIPMNDVAPETLIDIAQAFSNTVTDSTEYYHRQELIVLFARATGQEQTASATASQLMAENRAFRARWLNVLQSGG